MTNYYVRETPDGADVLRRISVNFSALICTCYEVSTAHQIVNALKALQAPPAAAVPDMATIRGAVARGWCHKATEDREMDVTLAECIAIEVRAMLAANKENNP